MADQENPETNEEQAPEGGAEEQAPQEAAAEAAPVEEPAAEAAAPAAAPAPARPPVPPATTPKERKLAARVRRGRRRPSTPEERKELRAAKATARSRRRRQEREKRAGAKGEGTPPAERAPGTPQTRLGYVVSDKADKTITVRIDIAKRHRRYRKIVRSSNTLHAHDERNDANEGDLVRVVESRPTSRTKRWRLVEILERAK
jgi:small subunit ribosomal protein S17